MGCFFSPASLDDYFEPNMWNLRLDLLFVEKGSRIFAFLVFGIAMATIALSCYFTLDLPCCKEGVYESASRLLGHHCFVECIYHDTAPLPPRDIES